MGIPSWGSLSNSRRRPIVTRGGERKIIDTFIQFEFDKSLYRVPVRFNYLFNRALDNRLNRAYDSNMMLEIGRLGTGGSLLSAW